MKKLLSTIKRKEGVSFVCFWRVCVFQKECNNGTYWKGLWGQQACESRQG